VDSKSGNKDAKRLLLFDIDGTLISSAGAGVESLKLVLAERFGIEDDLHDIEIAGMTDSGIVISILKKHKIAAPERHTSSRRPRVARTLEIPPPSRSRPFDRQCLARRATQARALRRLAFF
jgi:beta-phosphoglucomutase-like phosphatase (HAD superfamily)